MIPAIQRAAERIKIGIDGGSVLICTDDFAEIIAEETHLAEVVEVLKLDRDDGKDGDLLMIVANELCNIGSGRTYRDAGMYFRRLARRLEKKQVAISAVLAKIEGDKE